MLLTDDWCKVIPGRWHCNISLITPYKAYIGMSLQGINFSPEVRLVELTVSIQSCLLPLFCSRGGWRGGRYLQLLHDAGSIESTEHLSGTWSSVSVMVGELFIAITSYLVNWLSNQLESWPYSKLFVDIRTCSLKWLSIHLGMGAQRWVLFLCDQVVDKQF